MLNKVSFLKDSDFKCLHDRRLPLALEEIKTLEVFQSTIGADIRFLESLRIMDYSLLLVVVELPQSGNSEGGEG